jgi:hypothetical protein
LASNPASADEGDIYYNTTDDRIRVYKNGAWVNLAYSDDVGITSVDYITFDTTPEASSTETGTMFWDSGDGIPKVILNANVELGLGQEQVALCKNATGASIAKGKVVYINGAQGQRPTVALSDSDSETTSSKTLGLTAETIADGAEGFVVTFGVLRGVNTDGLTEGSALWLSSTAGGYQTSIPAEPAHLVFVGYVVKASASAGEIFVNPQNGYELTELHGVTIENGGALTDNEVLAYDSASGIWINQTASEAGLQPLDTELTAIAGLTSAADRLPYFTGSGTASLATFTSFGRSLVDDADAAAARTTLGLGTMAVETASNYLTTSTASSTYLPLSAATANQIIYKNASNVASGSSGLTYDGTHLKVTGNLESRYSSGDEGGEIVLNKPVTNTTITDGVVIDVHQNRLRIFEQGGTNRGVYIDITAAGASVGTNLVGGGSASNSFTTISTPSGTSPVADSSTDTLTLTAGTGITITGDSAADTIEIAVASSTYQPLDAELTAIAGLTSAADALPYFTGSGTASITTLTTFGRSLIDDADAATARTTLGLGTSSTKDVAATGDASATQVVLGNDTRLTDNRVASQVSLTNNASTDTTTYPMLVGSATTGSGHDVFIDFAALSYNASTNTLNSNFSGNLTGDTISATATSATPTLWSTVTTGTIGIGTGITTGTINIGTSTPGAGQTKTLNLGTNGSGGAASNVNIGYSSGTTTVNGALNVVGGFTSGSGTTSTAPIKLTSGTNLTSVTAGAVEYDGTITTLTNNTSLGRTAISVTAHTSGVGTSGIGGAPTKYVLFPSANDTISLPVGTYMVQAGVKITISGSTVAATTSLDIRGTSGTAVGNFFWMGVGASSNNGGANLYNGSEALGTSFQVTGSSAGNPRVYTFTGRGILEITTAGTIIPSYLWSAAPTGGTVTLSADNYLTITPISSSGTVASTGGWG